MESTVISICPMAINPYSGFKPGISPAVPEIPAAKENDFVVVHIPDSQRAVYVMDGKSLWSMVPGEQVAGAIASNYISSMMGIEHDAFPGVKAIPGKFSKDEILKSFGWDEDNGLGGLKKVQLKWFTILVKMADDKWTNPMNPGKHRSISDIERAAAKSLGLNRDWLTSVPTDQIKCPACRLYIPGDATICFNCKTPIGVQVAKEA